MNKFKSAVAEHWSNWQIDRHRRLQTQTHYVDWADHPIVWKRVCELAFGSAVCDVSDFLRGLKPSLANQRVLSLCSGDGEFEIDMVARGVFGEVLGLDLSPVRVQAAKARCNLLPAELYGRCAFSVADVNKLNLPAACVDAVFAKSALHHIEGIDELFSGVRSYLRPEGRLIALDFFGPSRFQWTDKQLREVHRIWNEELPLECKIAPNGVPYEPIQRPSVDEMVALDPSEAVRSGELYDKLREYFTVEVDIALGGTLLNLLLWGDRVNRFRIDHPAHCEVLLRTVELEQKLIRSGELASDFRLIVARRRG